MQQTPPAEIPINEALVKQLLEDQHPDLADMRIQLLDSGWDNAMFRLGDHLLLRFPRRKIAVPLLEREQKWLPGLQERLPIPISAPLRIGHPSADYPWPWSVLPFLEGVTADLEAPNTSQAEKLGTFLKALHQPAPADAPVNEFRGVPLSTRASVMEERMDWLAERSELMNDQVRQRWYYALEAPFDGQRVWLHGDLHARNVIVREGTITGIVDWGDMACGDPATDLVAAWGLFAAPGDRERFWAAYDTSDPLLRQRALGWAILFGVAILGSGLLGHEQHARIGARILERVLED